MDLWQGISTNDLLDYSNNLPSGTLCVNSNNRQVDNCGVRMHEGANRWSDIGGAIPLGIHSSGNREPSAI